MRQRKSNRVRRRRWMITELLEDRRLLAGPYAPAAGRDGSTAIAKDDARIEAWATAVVAYVPGADVDLEFQTPQKALGPAEGSAGDVVTLGRGGEITLAFDLPIWDGIGPDLAVFENSFVDTFLELGYVEVSSDGTNFFRFETDSLTQSAVGPFDPLDPTEINNFAGKYRQGFGTPLDLEELADVSPLLNVNAVTHVRLVDVVGDGSEADSSGDPIFDPFPTLGSAGLDVDAVAVLHRAETSRDVVDFEDVGGTLAAQSAFSGPVPNGTTITGPFGDSVVVGSFGSERLTFNNAHSIDFGSWNQWAYSNAGNTTTAGYLNQFSSYAGGGANGSPTFAIAFPDQNDDYARPTITRDAGDTRRFDSVLVTNTTYAALSMRNGDSFAKKFGGPSGDDRDYLRLTVEGKDASQNSIGKVDFYLADYRFDDNSLDYIVDEWVKVDLSSLALASSLEFTLDSSDRVAAGINTPTYVAVDDIVLSTPALLIDVADDEVAESDGKFATRVRVSRPDADTGKAVDVTVAPVDTALATLPTSVTIPAGERFVEFSVAVVDNAVVDGEQQIDIQVSADGFATASRTLTIQDDDLRQLSLTLDRSGLVEGSSLEATVTRNVADVSNSLTVNLNASESSLVTVDESVTIAVGKTSATFSVMAVDDDVDSPTIDVILSAAALGFIDADIEFDLIDNDTPTVSLQVDPDTYSETDARPTAGLEDVGRRLISESFDNGSDGAGGFQSEGLMFNNEFDETFGSWLGWSYANLTDTTTPGFMNQYSASSGSGATGSGTYAVATAFPGTTAPTISRDPASPGFHSLEVTNTTYAALSMKDGDDFAKKFGGETGDDPDYLKLIIDGFDETGSEIGKVEFFLSDFRSAVNDFDYIINEWTTVDLSSVSDAVQLSFSLESSDVGSFGINTPAYFAVDNVVLKSSTPTPTVAVIRNVADLSDALEVRLSSSDRSEATLPESAVIPAGASLVRVPLTIVDDFIVDGDQSVNFTVQADSHRSSTSGIVIQDDDVAELTLSLLDSTLSEADGIGRGIVHRNMADLAAPLVVDVSAELDGQLLLPDNITIPEGQSATEFSFTVDDNAIVDGDRKATLRVSADGFLSSAATISIIDDDVAPPTLDLKLDLAVLNEADAPTTITLEDVGAALADESFDNGADLAGPFESGTVQFNNSFDPTFGSWAGWAVSNTTDATTPGYLNQYSAVSGSGASDSASYAVASAPANSPIPTISLVNPDAGESFESLLVTNTTYAALSMAEGDAFAKKFGGDSGDDADYFLLTIEGRDTNGESVGTVDFYLADFRFDDNGQDFIVDQWTHVDVSSLVGAISLEFSLSSTDVGDFGMNTPAYFAVDHIVLAGNAAVVATATVSRSDEDLSEPLIVDLRSDDATEAMLPRSVVIPSGAESASFKIHAVDDTVVDGTRVVEIIASTDTHLPSSVFVSVDDDDDLRLTAALSEAVVNESNAVSASQLTVHRNTEDNSLPLRIDVTTTGGDLVVPDTVTIPAGAASFVFDVGVIDNFVRDGDRTAGLGLAADAFAPANTSLEVRDDETSALIVSDSDGETRVREVLTEDEVSVSLSARPLSDVVVDVVYASEDIEFDVQRVSFTPEQWDTPQVITISAIADLQVEDAEKIMVAFRVDRDASDPLFADAADSVLEVIAEDYQPTNLTISEDGTAVFLLDEATGVRLISNEQRQGIDVRANDLSQTIVLDSLKRTGSLIQIDAAGGDDTLVVRGSRFTAINGGDGYDKLVLDLYETGDLIDFLDNRAIGFEEITINSASTDQVAIDVARLDSIVPENGTLIIRIEGERGVAVRGKGTQMDPILIGGAFAQVIQLGEYQLRVVSQTHWQNVLNHWDVDRNGEVTSIDALAIVNQLAGLTDATLLPITSIEDFAGMYYDVSGDQQITPLDALLVINQLARQFLQPEAESVVANVERPEVEPLDRELETVAPEVVRRAKVAVFSEINDGAIREMFASEDEGSDGDETEEDTETSLKGLNNLAACRLSRFANCHD